MLKFFLFAFVLITSSTLFATTSSKSVTIKSSNLKQDSKAQARKPSGNVMGKSKTDIRMILDTFQDNDGAYIQLIRKLPNETYKVDIKSITGICVGHRVQIIKLRSTEAVKFLDRVYECD